MKKTEEQKFGEDKIESISDLWDEIKYRIFKVKKNIRLFIRRQIIKIRIHLKQPKDLVLYLWHIAKYRQVLGFARFLTDTYISSKKLASKEVAEKRWEICKACPHLVEVQDNEKDLNSALLATQLMLKTLKHKEIRSMLETSEIEIKRKLANFSTTPSTTLRCDLCTCAMRGKVKWEHSKCADRKNPLW